MKPVWKVAAVLAVVLAATLWPVAPAPSPMARWCLICGERGVADAIDNVLLFMPLGVVLAGLSWPWRRSLLAAVLLSAIIEGLQLGVVTGRDASPGDVLFDGPGAGLGLALTQLLNLASVPAPLRPRIDAAWIGGLFAPLGLAARGGRRRWPLLVAVPLALAVVPAGGLLPTPLALWAAAAAGCAVGSLLPRRVAPALS